MYYPYYTGNFGYPYYPVGQYPFYDNNQGGINWIWIIVIVFILFFLFKGFGSSDNCNNYQRYNNRNCN